MKYGVPIFLLLSIVGSEAKDCSASNGYIKGHRETDVCDYECGYSQCGDICINLYGKFTGRGQCYCSKGEKTYLDPDEYCCPDNLPENSTKCTMQGNDANCTYGTILKKKSSCKFTTSISVFESTHCFNDYKSSEVVGPQSYYQCDNGQCVEAFEMCRGYPICEDSSDLKECDQHLRCSLDPDLSHNKTSLVSDLTPGHYLCDYSQLRNDGKYDTITREDETDLDILTKKDIDYNSIKECKDNSTGIGYLCGENCLDVQEWCTDIVTSCGSFTANNVQLCSNTTFWAEKSCEIIWPDRPWLKFSVGRRCSGSAQQCIYPWYLTNNNFYEYQVNNFLNISNKKKYFKRLNRSTGALLVKISPIRSSL